MTLNSEEYDSPPANSPKGFFKRSYSIEVLYPYTEVAYVSGMDAPQCRTICSPCPVIYYTWPDPPSG